MFFWNSLAFSMIQRMLAIWSLVPLPFHKTSLNICKFSVRVLLKPGLNFEHYFPSVWDECNCAVVWAIFGIAFLWDWNENWPFTVYLNRDRKSTWKNQYSFMIKKKPFSQFVIERLYLNIIKAIYDNPQLLSYWTVKTVSFSYKVRNKTKMPTLAIISY